MLNGEVVKFNNIKIVTENYRYRGAVYNYNSLRHNGGTSIKLLLEISWGKPGGPSEC